jgi:hypothetical protein
MAQPASNPVGSGGKEARRETDHQLTIIAYAKENVDLESTL